MKIETDKFDIADELDSEAAITIYLTDALETADPAYVAHALGKVAKARGMSEVARQAGLSRTSLYAALSPEGNPTLATLMTVMKALGVRLAAVPVGQSA